jgi:hypothetical protein
VGGGRDRRHIGKLTEVQEEESEKEEVIEYIALT